jgi:ATP-dependent helicase/nuclease subunit B
MVLRFIYGRSGSGKTYLCLREIEKRLKENCTHPLVLLVPEQYTFQAEKELIRVLESGGILKVEVLSFRRLAFRVFNEAGGLTSPHLHPAGKCMLIAKALFKLKPELNMFAKAADHQGFLSEISALITEFKRYNIDPSKLLRVADSWRENDLLRTKISEIAAIYQEYDNLLSEKHSDTDDDLSRAALKIQEIDLYQGAEIWVDGFSGFTPQEYLLLAELFSQAQKVNICLDTDSLDQTELLEGTDTFETVKKTHYRLCQIAAEKGLEIEYHRINVGSASSALPRFKNSIELSHLEKNFYTYPPEIYKEETEDINIFSALNPFTEIEAVARKVLKLCRERGWRYRDIAVLTGDLENYGRLIEVIFAEYEIPYFLDRKLEITQHPLIRLVLSIFAIFKENWSYEAVFSYLKTGLTALPQEDIDRLENYVLASGIKGKRWTNDEDWKMDPGFSSRSPGKEQDEELRRINRLRLEITEPLLKFRHKTKGRRTANEICSALVELLETLEVPAQIERQIDTYKQEGQLYLAQGNAQIWNILMEVFDQVCEIMKEEKMGIEKFASILSSGLNEYKIGFIPISLEQVLVGNIDRSRSPEVKALFILGVNEGTFPANTLDEGILSDADRAKLQLAGVELSGDTKTKAFEEQYLVYRVLAIPSRYLHLSWSIADQEGKSRRPSLVLSRLRKIFPKVSEQSNILPQLS